MMYSSFFAPENTEETRPINSWEVDSLNSSERDSHPDGQDIPHL
jgi:hypothetical protein